MPGTLDRLGMNTFVIWRYKILAVIYCEVLKRNTGVRSVNIEPGRTEMGSLAEKNLQFGRKELERFKVHRQNIRTIHFELNLMNHSAILGYLVPRTSQRRVVT